MKTAVWTLSISVVALLIVVAFLYRKINQLTPVKSHLPADGTVCTMPDGTAGTYKNGVCVKTVIPGSDSSTSSKLVPLNDVIQSLQKLQPDSKVSLDLKFS